MERVNSVREILITLLPAILAGLLPLGLWVVSMQRENWKQWMIWNLLLTVILDIAAGTILLQGFQGTLLGNVFGCIAIPIVLLIAYAILLFFTKRIYQRMSGDRSRIRIFRFGLVVILVLPMLFYLILIVLGPALCRVGIGVCSDLP